MFLLDPLSMKDGDDDGATSSITGYPDIVFIIIFLYITY